MSDTVSASTERPSYIEGPEGPILGFVTTAPDARGNVVIFSGGWHGGSINANRMIVRLARRLAAKSHNVVRFDWRGAGESPGHIRFFRLDDPGERDALVAVDIARVEADLPTSLVGVCIGTRAVLAAAPDIDNLEAVALVSFPLPAGRAKVKRAEAVNTRDAVRQALRPSMLKGWFQPATRRVYVKFLKLKWQAVTKRFRPTAASVDSEVIRRQRAQADDLDALVAQLSKLFDRRVRVLLLFGTDDAAYAEFATAIEGPLGEILERNSDHVEVRTVTGDLSGFSSLESQQAMIDNVAGWLSQSD